VPNNPQVKSWVSGEDGKACLHSLSLFFFSDPVNQHQQEKEKKTKTLGTMQHGGGMIVYEAWAGGGTGGHGDRRATGGHTQQM
jgi:hypothetical protein